MTDEYKVHSNGMFSPVLTHMMNKRTRPQTTPSSDVSHADSLKSGEQPRALKLADALDNPPGAPLFIEAAAMLRKLYVHNTELENSLIKKSVAIQKIWKERDELRKRVQADEALLHRAAAMLTTMPVKHPQQSEECDALMELIKEHLKC